MGYINKKGKFVVSPIYENAWTYFEGLAPVKLAGKWGYVDPTGKVMIVPQFEDGAPRYSIGVFREGLAEVKIGSQWGFINKQGQVVIRPRFVASFGFSNGLAEVWDPDCGYIDTSGKIVWSANRESGVNGSK
ncbi:MAG: WG repeat-containing protein [Terriglobia bacterium]